MLSQEKFERLSTLMYDKGVIHEAFEILADLRQSERLEHQGLIKALDQTKETEKLRARVEELTEFLKQLDSSYVNIYYVSDQDRCKELLEKDWK